MNARNFLYVNKFNKSQFKRLADNKLETKKLFLRTDIPTSRILKSFSTRNSVREFDWNLPQNGFVIKPARGFGGEGILVFKKWENGIGTTSSGREFNIKQIKSHILDIFDGIYSLQSLPDQAYIEERITPSSFFARLSPLGLTDIRVIVFNKIPVMAMLRLPTAASGGKANLHQGALGIGVGIRTGITTFALSKHIPKKFIPDTKIKAAGIKIPDWEDILLLASNAQNASGLGYAGVDIVVDKNRGPMVLEINARPGLEIQNVNRASLRERLERVEELPVVSCERGVEIARSVFAENFLDKVVSETKVLSVIEPITILTNAGPYDLQAKLDTGAFRTSIDASLVNQLNLPLLNEQFKAVSATGEQMRPGVKLEFILGGKKISTIASVAQRSHLQYPIIIGRRDLKGFYVNPNLPQITEKDIQTEEITN